MAKNPQQKQTSFQSKKHLARLERERLYRRYILIATAIVITLVAALIIYGILNERVFKARQPVATVNGERISVTDFQAQTRYARQRVIGDAINTYQFIQFLGDNPDTQASFAGQLAQAQAQLEPTLIGEQILTQLVDDALIRQEAKRRGITVTEADIDKAIEEALASLSKWHPNPPAYSGDCSDIYALTPADDARPTNGDAHRTNARPSLRDFNGGIVDVFPIQQHLPADAHLLVQVQQPVQALEQRGLATAGRTDDGR